MYRTLQNILEFVATCGYIGYLPVAPGTYASILGCIIMYFSHFSSMAHNLLFLCVFAVCSVISVNLLIYDGEDPSYIVIDELAGMFITMAGHKPTVLNLFIGFILFRIFDIIKPYPIRRVEHMKGGYGVVADDVLAGVFANLVLYLFLFLYGKLKILI